MRVPVQKTRRPRRETDVTRRRARRGRLRTLRSFKTERVVRVARPALQVDATHGRALRNHGPEKRQQPRSVRQPLSACVTICARGRLRAATK